MEMLNNHIIDQFEDFKKEFGEDHFISIQAKKDVVFLLKNNTGKIILVKQLWKILLLSICFNLWMNITSKYCYYHMHGFQSLAHILITYTDLLSTIDGVFD